MPLILFMPFLNKKLLLGIRLFYREYTVFNLILTLVGVYFIITLGRISYVYIFWLKSLGYFVLAKLYLMGKKKHLYFFHNLGISSFSLFGASIVLDILTSLSLFIITHQILNH